jgi:hypothetical protein
MSDDVLLRRMIAPRACADLHCQLLRTERPLRRSFARARSRKETTMAGTRRPKESKTKEVVISLAVSVDEGVTQEEIAKSLEGAVGSLASKVHNVSNVQIRTVPRMLAAAAPGDPGGGGYDTRLWEVTCDIFGGRLQSPGDPVVFQQELERVSSQVRELSAQVEQLAQRGWAR